MQFTLTFTGGAADIQSVIALLKALDNPSAETKGVTRSVAVAPAVRPGPPTPPPADEDFVLEGEVEAPVAAAPVVKRTRGPNKPKTAPSDARFAEAAQAAAAAPSVVDEPAKPASTLLTPPVAAPAASAEAIDADTVRDRMAEVIAKCGTDPVLTGLKKWSARRLQELDKKHYPEFYAILGNALNDAAVSAVL